MYPEFFPKNCPPIEAIDEEIESYRLCPNNEISHYDFLSFYELGKLKHSNDIKKYGVSLLTDYQQSIAMLGMPKYKKSNNKYIAKGKTAKGLGVVLRTPSKDLSTHITWWLKINSQPENYFSIVYNNEEE